MTNSKLYLLVTLCLLVIVTTFIGSTQSASCCLRYSKRPLPCKHLKGYTIQNINTSCDINAIIFHLPEKFVCANPRMPWTQRAMKCVDEMKKKKDREEQTPGTIASA